MLTSKPKLSALLLSTLLTICTMASAASKHSFPDIPSKELAFYLGKEAPKDNPSIYLFSSLSFLRRPPNIPSFSVTTLAYKHLLPFATIDPYPEPAFPLQSEFFDITIWGQLGNYFNMNVELLELEQSILALLDEISDINERYKALVTSPGDSSVRLDLLVTIDRRNFFTSQHLDEESFRRFSNRQTESLQSVSRDADEAERETLRDSTSRQLRRQASLTPRLPDTSSLEPSDTSRAPGGTPDDADNPIFSFFLKLSAIFRYLRENRLEAAIYLWLSILLAVFIKDLFTK